MMLENEEVWEIASRQLIRAVRGKRSQVAFSRRLGYRGNVAASWEGGHRAPTAEALVDAMRALSLDVDGGFARFHADSITPVVLPLMLAEAATAAALYWRAPADSPNSWHRWNVGSIAFVWASTFLLSVPCHERLSSRGWHAATHALLVRTNWLRTIVWTGRAGALFLAALGILRARGPRER